jgi:hypothetical protein
MLAQNFKTPADLDLPVDLYEAHIKLLGMLERGELKHISEYGDGEGFNMNWVFEESSCGTIGCIAGWASLIARGNKYKASLALAGTTGELRELYFPAAYRTTEILKGIKPAQAAIALRNYLTFGEACWDEVFNG